MNVTFFFELTIKLLKKTIILVIGKNQDIADFYRAVEILKQAGLHTEVDSGVTDEGDPWFVFLRPENGDVIAHFALVDNVFVAVSSINHKVYRGKNIRDVVDQMLTSYPALLPQNKTGGTLYLHPTAAISAFLAAAFIMTLDGVKPSNIGDVIFKAVASDLPGVNIDRNLSEGVSRLEVSKGAFSELTGANYHVAILGAALIAHELFNGESELEISRFSEQKELENISSEVSEKETDGVQAITNPAVGVRLNTLDDVSYSTKHLVFVDSLEEGDKKEAVADKADSEHQENAITKMNFDKTFAQPGFDAVEEFEVTWKNQIISAENIGYLKPSKNNIIEEFQVISEFKEELNQDAKTPVDDFVQVADNNKDSSQTVVSIDQVESLRALNNFGITLDNSGEIKVIALNEFGLSPLSDNFHKRVANNFS